MVQGMPNHPGSEKEPKMPKMKTKSGAKKRFRVTATGKVKFSAAYRRHMMRNKPQKMKRDARGMSIMFKTDGETVKQYWLPYAN
jgi:large subunit ribosomal protein L35